jgi:hypothetical protein
MESEMAGENEQQVAQQPVMKQGTLANPPKTGMAEDPVTMPDETENFVIDAFDQMQDIHSDDGEGPAANAREQVTQVVQQAPPSAPVQQVAPVQEIPQQGVESGVTEQQVVQAQPAAPPAPVQQTAAPQVAPVEQQAPAPTAQQQPIPGPQDFASLATELQKNEQLFIDKLAETHYKVSEQEQEKFLQGDPGLLSKAMAKVHVNAVSSVLNVVAQQMPNMVFGLLQARQMNNEREQQFWSTNKHLDPQKHREAVLQAARTYRATNPKADPATMTRMVGALAALQLGIPVPQPGQQQQVVQQQQQVRTPGPVVRQAPVPGYNPVGVATPGTAQVVEENPWGRMAGIMQADDQGAFDF